jgi:hypothetical protein
MSANQGKIECKSTDQMVEVVTKLTVSGVMFNVESKDGLWIIYITGA